MNKSEIIKMWFETYKTMNLDLKKAAPLWGMKYSTATKLFGGKDAKSEKFLIENRIIPTWRKVSGKRLWNLVDIYEWMYNTELK